MYDMFHDGHTVAQIAAAVGQSRATVYHGIRKIAGFREVYGDKTTTTTTTIII